MNQPIFVKVFVPWYWDFMAVDSSWWPRICVFCSSFVTSNGNDTDFEMCLNYMFFWRCWKSHKMFNNSNPRFNLAFEAAGGGRITSFSIRLPHNSLLVCWEGFQEFWRHEVRPDRKKMKHEVLFSTKRDVSNELNHINYGYLLYIGGWYYAAIWGLKKNIKGIIWTNHESISTMECHN